MNTVVDLAYEAKAQYEKLLALGEKIEERLKDINISISDATGLRYLIALEMNICAIVGCSMEIQSHLARCKEAFSNALAAFPGSEDEVS